jgi:hypothetical protein
VREERRRDEEVVSMTLHEARTIGALGALTAGTTAAAVSAGANAVAGAALFVAAVATVRVRLTRR